MHKFGRQAWKPWALVGLLFVLCGVLALLQNRWLQKLSRAEDARLHRDLQDSLERFRVQFDATLSDAAYALLPSPSQIRDSGAEKALSAQARLWKADQAIYFSRVALAFPEDDTNLLNMDPVTGQLTLMSWPPEWSGTHQELRSRLRHDSFGPPPFGASDLIEIPLTHSVRGFDAQPWVLLELNLDYLRRHTIPALLKGCLGSNGDLQYQAEIASEHDRGRLIFRTSSGRDLSTRAPDASVSILQMDSRRSRPPWRDFGEARPPGAEPPPSPPGQSGPMGPPGRWRLTVRYNPGSLESVLVRARWQNAAMAAGLLGLILVTGMVLVRYSRRTQRLAELQFNFVAGVSHELRTPLTVIRTAAYNLRSKVVSRPEQIERYSELIQSESERLSALVEQVLQFASARSGNLVRLREPISVDALIEQSLNSNSSACYPDIVVEKHIEPGLPPVFVDPVALQHALNNLVSNALKHGTGTSKWIGIFAAAGAAADGPAVEIRVADRGPGIPMNEQKQIFEPFFRGGRPVRDQVHGAGLGLSLVRYIMEAHGGSVSVATADSIGTEFTLRIPVHPHA